LGTNQALEKGADSDMTKAYAKLVACTQKFKEDGERLFVK